MKKKNSEKSDDLKKEEKIKKSQKNDEKSHKIAKKEAKKQKKGGFLWFLGVSALSVMLLLVCQFFLENTVSGKEKFYDNTHINGIDVSGMTASEAENAVLSNMLLKRDEIEIELTQGDRSWMLSGKDFELSNQIQPVIANLSRYGKEGNFFQNAKVKKQVANEGKNFVVSYLNVLSGIDKKLDEVVAQVERPARPAKLIFTPDGETTFTLDEGQSALLVNRDELQKQIDDALLTAKKVKIEIPIIEVEEDVDLQALKNSVGLVSRFSTNYAKSSAARKNNIKKALSSFNGMIVEPGQTVSFNEATGARTEENGYKTAHIIVGGVYVDGVGGGVCQASTTLYNALLRADLEIISVNHHSLPASYVPLSFDAMVSGEYCDLIFRNNKDTPIYIKTFANDSEVGVEIYGKPLDDGMTISTRSELVKVLPHGGDKILPDKNGEYSDKILYKGEYFRVKYPREGYESKGFLQFFKDGQLVEEREIRHDFYQPTEGIVMEGVETPASGMTIPASDVKIIKPQKNVSKTSESVANKLQKEVNYNP